MKMQRFDIFLQRNVFKKKVRNHYYYTGEYRNTAYSMRDLKYCVPNEFPMVFHNECNYDYHNIITST